MLALAGCDKSTSDDLKQKAEEARQNVETKAKEAKEAVGQGIEKAKPKVDEFIDKTKEAAKEAEPKLKDMALIRYARLSVQPVTDEEWRILRRMGGLI